jgi:hypothetical protein
MPSPKPIAFTSIVGFYLIADEAVDIPTAAAG